MFFSVSENSKLGIIFMAFGFGLYFMGCMSLFSRSLLLMGNIFFLAGMGLMFGLKGSFSFFFGKNKARSTGIFFLGLLLVVMRWSFIGGLVQIVGLLGIFKSFLPTIFDWLIALPGIGHVLKYNSLFNWLRDSAENRKRPKI